MLHVDRVGVVLEAAGRPRARLEVDEMRRLRRPVRRKDHQVGLEVEPQARDRHLFRAREQRVTEDGAPRGPG